VVSGVDGQPGSEMESVADLVHGGARLHIIWVMTLAEAKTTFLP